MSAIAAICLLAGILGCSTPMTTREKGAVIGAVSGAAAGGIIGSTVARRERERRRCRLGTAAGV